MNWQALLQTALSGLINVGIGALATYLSGSTAVGAGTVAVGTAVAHGLTSPFGTAK